jgi:hypothetical protein
MVCPSLPVTFHACLCPLYSWELEKKITDVAY